MRFVVSLLLLACFQIYTLHADTVYLTKDEALRLVLGADCQISYSPKELPADLLHKLENEDVAPEEAPVAHIFECSKFGMVTGYAVIDSQVGKHSPITYIVGISPSGAVTKTEVMIYRENYGSTVREQPFITQYSGKTVADCIGEGSMQVGHSIKNVSGATLSARALTRGVRRDLIIWDYFYNRGQQK